MRVIKRLFFGLSTLVFVTLATTVFGIGGFFFAAGLIAVIVFAFMG